MSLNPSQRAAVEHGQGPLLVLAGAGSGKTRVITTRIARLVKEGTRPEAILAVSFTNKAAAEMVERLEKMLGKEAARKVWMSTFHSFGVRFLQEEREHLGFGDRFVVFDQGDCLGLVREILRRERGKEARRLDPMAILARISLWKNRFEAPPEVKASEVEYDDVAREIYPSYEASLRAMCAVDFDDLVVAPVRILKTKPAVRQKWRARFRHLLVDEFQDTNRAQLEMIEQLTNELGNLCVVGDDDQAIYGWRGAEVGNILGFEDRFKGATVVKLEDNYRSRAPILSVANAAIAQGTQSRHRKVLRASQVGGDRVHLSVLDDPEQEARFVTAEIRAQYKAGRRWQDMAILYRSNLQARLLEEELRVAGVPYDVHGGTELFDRKEVKDVVAYLRCVVNPRDEISLRRILNYPARGIGETTVERIERFAKAKRIPFAEAIAKLDTIDDVPDSARRGVKALLGAIGKARETLRSGVGLAPAARALVDEVGLRAELADVGGSATAGDKRYGNVEALFRSIDRYEASEREEKPTIGSFLARITLKPQGEESDPGDRVTLSTLHGAKGLEFHTVFLIGCVEGQLPHTRTLDPKITEASPTDVEEERRLFYVGVTRAREQLFVTHFKRKMMRGKPSMMTPSRFLQGLPEADTEQYERKDVGALESNEIAEMGRALLAQLQG